MNYIGLYTLVRREIEKMFRVSIQTLITPLISALLFIFIFGFVVGQKIDLIAGVPYIKFVLPGILMMNVIASSFMHSSSSVYFGRFIRNIEEILVAPFSHLEMIVCYVAGAVARGVIVGVGIFIIAIFFNATAITHFGALLFYIVSVAIIFSLVGILIGLWANGFEQLNVLNTFVIMPFSFLGGVFYSITMLPVKLHGLVMWNPFFYFIDGMRYSMIGVSEANAMVGYILIFGLITSLGALVHYLFKIGWRLRA